MTKETEGKNHHSSSTKSLLSSYNQQYLVKSLLQVYKFHGKASSVDQRLIRLNYYQDKPFYLQQLEPLVDLAWTVYLFRTPLSSFDADPAFSPLERYSGLCMTGIISSWKASSWNLDSLSVIIVGDNVLIWWMIYAFLENISLIRRPSLRWQVAEEFSQIRPMMTGNKLSLL